VRKWLVDGLLGREDLDAFKSGEMFMIIDIDPGDPVG
jgi:hypothetical protein